MGSLIEMGIALSSPLLNINDSARCIATFFDKLDRMITPYQQEGGRKASKAPDKRLSTQGGAEVHSAKKNQSVSIRWYKQAHGPW